MQKLLEKLQETTHKFLAEDTFHQVNENHDRNPQIKDFPEPSKM